MDDMLVRSKIELSVPVAERHINAAREAASYLTTDKSSIKIEVVGEGKNWIYTTFPVKRARQVDVCDRIAKEMSMEMEDYQDQILCFLKSEAEQRRDQRKLARAKERRRQARMLREAAKQNKETDFAD
ncbi:MAG: hypothetical protein IJI54_02685 [Kiritimatiellae bacterium]|nr:hypothetical protein [Kiritimatiellia bacterium]